MKMLLIVAVLLTLSGCKTKDCMGEFMACLQACDNSATRMTEGSQPRNGLAGLAPTRVKDRDAAAKCQENCHLDPSCNN